MPVECGDMMFAITSSAIASLIRVNPSQRGVNKHNLLKAAVRREKALKNGNVPQHMSHMVKAAKERIAGYRVCDDSAMIKKSIRRKHTMLKQRSRKRKAREERLHNEATDTMSKKITTTRKGMKSKKKAKAGGEEKPKPGKKAPVARAGSQAARAQPAAGSGNGKKKGSKKSRK